MGARLAMSPPALARFLALLVPAALLAGAFGSEYFGHLTPCEMCWWQRYAHFAALPFALLAFLLPQHKWSIALAALAVLASGLIGGFHAGVEYHWWQGLTACSVMPGAGGGDPLEAIMNAPIISCNVPQWTLLGVSLAGFNFLFSVATAFAVFVLLARPSAR